MKDPSANPLDYAEGGALNARRQELSAWLDGTDPDLSAFDRRGGKMVVTIGTDDTLASPGSQLDYYQAVLDRMGRPTVDRFARLFVIPQANHGLQGRTAAVDGDGRDAAGDPDSQHLRQGRYADGVGRTRVAPPASVVVKAGKKSLPLCGYPQHPHYVSGPPDVAASYRCQE